MKFWAFIVGAAPLDPSLEAFWGELGFVVIQGYGLTETAPIVTLNHPFGTKKGSVGKAIAGVEVKIAATAKSWCAARTSRAGTSTRTRRPRARSRTAGSTPATSVRSARTASSTSAGARRK